jgi:hypothetical protein
MADTETVVSSAQDLLKVVVEDAVPALGKPWWRGQPAGKELIPKAYRDSANRRMEWLRTTQFVQRARTRHARVPDDKQHSDWLFLMQHYRLPTRLLDWTESPLIGCYFAVRNDPENPGDSYLWALSPEALNITSHIGAPDLIHPNEIAPYLELPFAREDPPGVPQGIIAVLATEIDFRMLQQQSAFTIHGTHTPLEALPDKDCFLKSYRVPCAAKGRLRDELFLLGIREANLFPDLGHLAADLRVHITATS